MAETNCLACGASYDPLHDLNQCPVCGSMDRAVRATDDGRISSREFVCIDGWRGPKTSKRRRYLEIRAGDSFYRKTGRWNRYHRVIDWEHDYYLEHIEDAQGRAIRHCEEPLSQHQGRGSARHRKA